MAFLDISLFGPFEVRVAGRPLTKFRTNKVKALLIYLVVEGNRDACSRESLMALLWPDMSQKSAQQNLRQTIYYLRKAVLSLNGTSGDFLLSDNETVAINPACDWQADVHTFTTLLQEVQSHDHSDLLTCLECQNWLQEAVRLYRGDFLSDFTQADSAEFEHWSENRMATFRRQMLDALNNLAKIYLRNGDYREAQTTAQRQLRMDEIDERAHRRLMEALARNGQRNEALIHYERCRRILQEQLGIEPMAQTTVLYEQIKAGDIGLRPEPPGRDLQDKVGDGTFGILRPAERDKPIQTIAAPKGESKAASVFISYKRNCQNDAQLAFHLEGFLSGQGHQVFTDRTMRSGTDWLEEIDRQLRAADFFVVLLSRESGDSEMVQAEVRRAYQYRRQQGRPQILPVRVAYDGLLPYSIDAFLNPLQYISWQAVSDNDRVANEILGAVAGQLPQKSAVQMTPMQARMVVSEDGRFVDDTNELLPPLPEVDPRFLEQLPPPGGAVKLRDTFYIKRDADERLRRQISQPGRITTIRAPRQTGKSSLLVRGIHEAQQQGIKVLSLDMQYLDDAYLASSEAFLRYLADFFTLELSFDPLETARFWEQPMGPQFKLTYFLKNLILPRFNAPLILTIDEADLLLKTNFHASFFGLLRSWNNSAAYDKVWEQLSIVMVISTEPYLLIQDIHQSPFNVGLKLSLQDFNEEQLQDLNLRHGSPVQKTNFDQFMRLLNGHPYLTRKALYTLVTEKMSWDQFLSIAPTDTGPFGDHLRRQAWLLLEEKALRQALKQVIAENRCDSEMSGFRLLRAGLIQASGDVYTCRCDLYRLYFQDKLGL